MSGDSVGNPIARLSSVLDATSEVDAGKSVKTVIAHAIGQPGADDDEVVQIVADLIGLYQQARDAASRIDESRRELYLEPFRRIGEFLANLRLSVQWDNVRDQLDPKTLASLRYCAAAYDQQFPSGVVEPEQIADLLRRVEDLLNFVETLDLEPELKTFLEGNLVQLLHVLRHYKVLGIQGIEETLNNVVGALIRIAPRAKESKNAREAFERFVKLVVDIDKLVSIALKGKQLAAPLLKLLTVGE